MKISTRPSMFSRESSLSLSFFPRRSAERLRNLEGRRERDKESGRMTRRASFDIVREKGDGSRRSDEQILALVRRSRLYTAYVPEGFPPLHRLGRKTVDSPRAFATGVTTVSPRFAPPSSFLDFRLCPRLITEMRGPFVRCWASIPHRIAGDLPETSFNSRPTSFNSIHLPHPSSFLHPNGTLLGIPYY